MNTTFRIWLKSGYGQWTRRVLLWGLFWFFQRYLVVGFFYKDSLTVMNWLTVGLTLQTVITYYVFGYIVFPRYVYKLNPLYVAGCLFIWHALIYQTNYVLFDYLQKINTGTRIERDWGLLNGAGLFGFVTNGVASFWSFFYSLPFALIFIGILAVKDIIAYRVRNVQLEKDKLNLELDFLKAQVNPHFLFNTLNSVYARVFDSDEQAADLVLRLSELMRYNLYETDVSRIALEKELGYVQNYLDLERNRLSDQYVVIDYEQIGSPDAYQIAPLLLIAFVENAFKHGVKGLTEPAYVQVSSIVTDGKLIFRVENSVPHRREAAITEPPAKSGGIGLGNVSRRLETLYKGRYELVVTPAEASYTVVLTIQVETLSMHQPR